MSSMPIAPRVTTPCRSISNVAIAADRADRSTSWTRRADQRPLPVGPTTSSDGEEAPWRIIAADSRAAPRRPTGRDLRDARERSEEHTSELQSRGHLVCRLLLEKKKKKDSTVENEGMS